MYCCIRRVWFVVAVAGCARLWLRLASWTGNDGYGRRVHSRKAFSNNGGYFLNTLFPFAENCSPFRRKNLSNLDTCHRLQNPFNSLMNLHTNQEKLIHTTPEHPSQNKSNQHGYHPTRRFPTQASVAWCPGALSRQRRFQ